MARDSDRREPTLDSSRSSARSVRRLGYLSRYVTIRRAKPDLYLLSHCVLVHYAITLFYPFPTCLRSRRAEGTKRQRIWGLGAI